MDAAGALSRSAMPHRSMTPLALAQESAKYFLYGNAGSIRCMTGHNIGPNGLQSLIFHRRAADQHSVHLSKLALRLQRA
jgi:hypothetical protein